MNGLTLVALLAVALAIVLAWRIGVAAGRRAERGSARATLRPAVATPVTPPAVGVDLPAPVPAPSTAEAIDASRRDGGDGRDGDGGDGGDDGGGGDGDARLADERARLVRSLAAENAILRARLVDAAAIERHLADLAEDRRRLFPALAVARAETARYRALVIDLENNAPPPLLDGPSAPDDLKLIVGIGPVLERLLQQMGITTYRQIARWSERDIDDVDARLPEFPGRIRRDAWVTQARAIHQSKYGEVLPVRNR